MEFIYISFYNLVEKIIYFLELKNKSSKNGPFLALKKKKTDANVQWKLLHIEQNCR
jgi:hypothetical protein